MSRPTFVEAYEAIRERSEDEMDALTDDDRRNNVATAITFLHDTTQPIDTRATIARLLNADVGSRPYPDSMSDADMVREAMDEFE